MPFFTHRPDWKSADSQVHAGVAPFLVRTLKVFDQHNISGYLAASH